MPSDSTYSTRLCALLLPLLMLALMIIRKVVQKATGQHCSHCDDLQKQEKSAHKAAKKAMKRGDANSAAQFNQQADQLHAQQEAHAAQNHGKPTNGAATDQSAPPAYSAQ